MVMHYALDASSELGEEWSYCELLGFLVIVLGQMIYSGFIQLPCLRERPEERAAAADFGVATLTPVRDASSLSTEIRSVSPSSSYGPQAAVVVVDPSSAGINLAWDMLQCSFAVDLVACVGESETGVNLRDMLAQELGLRSSASSKEFDFCAHESLGAAPTGGAQV